MSNLDRTYGLLTADILNSMLAQDEHNLISYQDDLFDCDDFAFNVFSDVRSVVFDAFKEHEAVTAFGVVFGTVRDGSDRHAANVAVLSPGMEVVCVEPQTDHVFYDCCDMFANADTLII